MAGYFANIRETIATIFEGMTITASHFVRKPFTIQYPDRIDIPIQDQLPFRYRGILDVDKRSYNCCIQRCCAN
jgi:formate hydrogenlyase subunit 6/NADH:ubiquinone oxidoreductase subunit I